MQRYEKYKDSGVAWIGEIPENWEVKRIKRLSSIKRGASPRPIANPLYFDDDGEWAWVRIADVSASERYLENTTQTLSELGASLSVKMLPNSFFLSIAGTVGKPIITKIKCCIHDGFVYFPYLNINVEYLYYIFSTGQPYLGLGKFGTQLNLNTDTVGEISIPLPDGKSIDTIVKFLDKKITEIDTLIDQKEQLLKLYEEEKKAIINRAVTKGIDANIQMKDSGIIKTKEIPKSWKITKFRFLFDLSKGLNITKKNLKSNGIPCINYGEIHSKYGFEIIPERDNLKCVEKDYLETASKALLQRGDFVFADTSEDIEGSGNFTHLHSDKNIFAGYHTVIARLKLDVNYRYIAYFIESIFFRNQIQEQVKGVKVYSITNTILKDIFILLPLKEEQNNIVQFIENELSRINKKIQKTKDIITLQKEYRTALISEVVTGKIKVTEEV